MEDAREKAGRPRRQQLIPFQNPSRTMCYANAGTNFLMSPPEISEFLARLPLGNGLIKVIGALARAPPSDAPRLIRGLHGQLMSEAPNAEFGSMTVQQDAHEWLSVLIERMEQNLSGGLRADWNRLTSIELLEEYTCREHGHQKYATVPGSICLSLAIVAGRPMRRLNRLTDVLTNHFATEVVDRRCSECNSRQSEKTLSFSSFPTILMLQYNRFVANANGTVKLDHPIDCTPTLTLPGVTYELVGVLVQNGGSVQSGHYYSVTRCVDTRHGFLVDDHKLWQLTPERVAEVAKDAYMLMFRKKPQEPIVEPQHELRRSTDVLEEPLCEPKRACEPAVVPEDSNCAEDEFLKPQEPVVEPRHNLKRSADVLEEPLCEPKRACEPQQSATPQMRKGSAEAQVECGEPRPADKLPGEGSEPIGADLGFPDEPAVGPEEPRYNPEAASDPEPNHGEDVGVGEDVGFQEAVVPEEPTLNEPEPTCTEEEEFLKQRRRLWDIMAMSLKDRSAAQKSEARSLKCKLDKLKAEKFPHHEVKKPAKAASERKTASRKQMSASEKEQALAAARVRMATVREDQSAVEKERVGLADRGRKSTERAGQSAVEKEQALAAARTRMATEPAQAADRGRKSTERAGQGKEAKERVRLGDRQRKEAAKADPTVNEKDGLNVGLVLRGRFNVPAYTIGEMSCVCSFCGARSFVTETGGRLCCMNGKVDVSRFSKPSEALLRLWFKDDKQGQLFRKHSRMFNNGLCLSSIRMNERRWAGYTPSIVIQGRAHQFLGPLQAKEQETPHYAQLYVHDPALETTTRIQNMYVPTSLTVADKALVRTIVEVVQAELKRVNPYVQDFQHIVEMGEDELQGGRLVISAKKRPAGEHARRYNLATNLAEVSVLTNCLPNDLVVTRRDGRKELISELNPNAQGLHFTVLFPHGDRGWDKDELHEATGKRVTAREFFAFHMAQRDGKLSYEEAVTRETVDYVHRAGRLYQEWICMGWHATENQKLNWQDMNQPQLRADTYKSVRDLVRAKQQMALGQPIEEGSGRVGTKVLAKSFVGSPRWYHCQFMDAMAICREYHKPDFFITMTCNPKWPEIQGELLPGQKAEDRPDLTARVFKAKSDKLMSDLKSGRMFGKVAAYLAVVEFQKRGLPHIHILLILADSDRLDTSDQVDSAITAELPPNPAEAEDGADVEQMMRLEAIVKANMVHGPCGEIHTKAPCMQDGKCEKGFPRDFTKHTVVDAASGFPVYRRRNPGDSGRTVTIRRSGIDFVVTNQYVVPYNPVLSLRYECHINVEKSTSPRNAKYLYKYLTKGGDRAMARTETDKEDGGRDEISDYKDYRSCGSCESVWHLLAFPISDRFPAVQVLRVHLEDEQMVRFAEGNEEVAVENARNTELVAFFKLNREKKNNLRYVDMPTEYTFSKKGKQTQKQWNLRQNASSTIGRVDNVHPAAGEVFYLRMLLNSEHCRGKDSFQALRSVDGVVLDKYKEACQQLGLLQDDREWEMVLEEADSEKSALVSRSLFVTIVLWCEPADPRALFERFWPDWTDDIKRKALVKRQVVLDDSPDAENDSEVQLEKKRSDRAKLRTLVLLDLQQRLCMLEKELRDVHLPEPTAEEEQAVADITGGRSVVVRDELDFDLTAMHGMVDGLEEKLTGEQAAIYHTVIGAVRRREAKCVFVKAKGGCGKTFLLNHLLAGVRSLEPGGCVALATATTGKAAMHLLKGRTFHSRFKAPLTLADDSKLRIPVQTELAKLIRMALLIIVDEATMMDNRLLQALDMSLRDITDCEKVFGGKVLVLSGDFRQNLPVVKGASRGGIIARCINQHPLFEHFDVMTLTQNMRVMASGDPVLMEWDAWLDEVGNGAEGEMVTIPKTVRCIRIEDNTKKEPKREEKAMKELIGEVFPDLPANLPDRDWLKGRAILTPTNANVDRLNAAMVRMSPGGEFVLASADTVDNVEDAKSFSIEYCNSLNPTGLPSHLLVLKPNVPLMLLRNLDPSSGLCNGTRLIFQRVSPNRCLMVCTVADTDKTVAIPRISLRPQEKEYPFEWSRRQFPVRVAFATTINKSQGETLKRIGVWLPQPVFGHGQFYVAPSRVGRPDMCTFAIKAKAGQPHNITRNVVFQEVLLSNSWEPPITVEQPVGPVLESDDMEYWNDYGAIEADFETEFTTEGALEEAGPPLPAEVRRRVAAKNPDATKRPGQPTAEAECYDPATVPVYVPECEYEEIRERNIAEKETEFERIFGYPYPRGRD